MIKLNDVLPLHDLNNTKIRFNLMIDGNWNPIEMFENGLIDKIIEGHYWNFPDKKSYKVGQITVGFIKINATENKWLLFHVGKITKDLDRLGAVGYEYISLDEYDKFIGELIITFKNNCQTMIRKATSVIDDCYVHKMPDLS